MAEEKIKKKKKKKSDIRVDSGEIVEGVVSEHSSTKKEKQRKRENKDGFAGEGEGIAERESEKLGEDAVIKKKKKKKSKKKHKDAKADPEAEEEAKVDPEAENVVKKKKSKKSKKESGSDVIVTSESSELCEKPGKGKREEDCDLGADENTDKEMKLSVDSEDEENNKDSTKKKERKKKKQTVGSQVDSKVVDSEVEETTAKKAKKKSKEKKLSVDSEDEENNKGSTKKERKKQIVDSTKDAKKKSKKKKPSEAEENNHDGKDAKKKRKKKQDVTTTSSKSTKRVKFSDQVEVFHSETEEEEEVKVVRGKRFTKEEDELVKQAVLEYIDNHALGDDGIKMVMECRSHPQVKGCWKEIASALPWRGYDSVYNRAHLIFEEGSSRGVWTKEDLELVKEFQKKHGNDWKTLGDAMGKSRKHVKDTWRRLRLAAKKKGHWTREEYQGLFDLVNKDLRMKAFQEKHSKHGMLKDNIPWMAISDVLGTRDHVNCCAKWYDQLTSPMVAKGAWANVDDYRLLEELLKLDAACIDDVDWDDLLENRDGEVCRKRWNQMIVHIGIPKSKTFAEQVEILAERYRPDIAEDREDFDNRPYDPED